MVDKKKRTSDCKNNRFYVGDIIENKVTGKKLEVGDVIVENDNVLWYGLYNIRTDGRCDLEDLSRYIMQEAFDNWKLLISL
jgi:hypothetical protein